MAIYIVEIGQVFLELWSKWSLWQYADRKRREGDEYWKGDLVMLSINDLKWQIKGRRTEKLTEQFVGPYKVKRVVSTNAIELEIPPTIKIHPVVNVSRVQLYKPQKESQRIVPLQPVVIDREEKYKVEKILNKRKVQGKDRFLVWWKGYTAEADIWEGRENLENAKELVKEFEREYGKETEEVRWQELEKEEKEFSQELPREFIAKLVYGWRRKRYKKKKEKR